MPADTARKPMPDGVPHVRDSALAVHGAKKAWHRLPIVILVVVFWVATGCSSDRVTLRSLEDVELAKLQGNWIMVYMEIKGQKVSDATLKTYALAIKENRWQLTRVVRHPDGGFQEQLRITSFRLYPSDQPKRIDLTEVTNGGQFMSQGIYKLEGDTLTICRTSEEGEKRPEKFETTNNACILVIWKRTHGEPQPNKSPEPLEVRIAKENG